MSNEAKEVLATAAVPAPVAPKHDHQRVTIILGPTGSVEAIGFEDEKWNDGRVIAQPADCFVTRAPDVQVFNNPDATGGFEWQECKKISLPFTEIFRLIDGV